MGSFTAISIAYRSSTVDLAAIGVAVRAAGGNYVVVANDGHAYHELRDVCVLRPDGNLGFGAGCNLAAEQTHSDILVFLNVDLKITRNED